MISDNDGDDGFDDYIVVIFHFRKRARVDTPSNRLPLSRHFCVIVGSGGSGQLPNPQKNVSLRLLVACLPCVCHLRIMDLSYVCRFSAVCLAIGFVMILFFGLFLSETGLPPKFAKLETQTTKMTSQISRACGNPIL